MDETRDEAAISPSDSATPSKTTKDGIVVTQEASNPNLPPKEENSATKGGDKGEAASDSATPGAGRAEDTAGPADHVSVPAQGTQKLEKPANKSAGEPDNAQNPSDQAPVVAGDAQKATEAPDAESPAAKGAKDAPDPSDAPEDLHRTQELENAATRLPEADKGSVDPATAEDIASSDQSSPADAETSKESSDQSLETNSNPAETEQLQKQDSSLIDGTEQEISRKRDKQPLVLKPRGPAGMALLVIGAVLCAFTLINLIVGNRNLGVYLPAIAGLPLLLWGIFKAPLDAWRARSRLARFLRGLLIVLYVTMLCVFGVCATWISIGLFSRPQEDADALIVLGAAVHGNEVTDTLAKRLDKAMEYYKQNPDTLIVVTGGMGGGENVSEAQAMHDYLIAAGIPEDSILMEEEATSTAENFVYCKRLLDERFGGVPLRIVFVTSDFHVMRAAQDAANAGFNDAQGLGAPTPFFTIPGAWMRESLALLRNVVVGVSDFASEMASMNPSDSFMGMLFSDEEPPASPTPASAATDAPPAAQPVSPPSDAGEPPSATDGTSKATEVTGTTPVEPALDAPTEPPAAQDQEAA